MATSPYADNTDVALEFPALTANGGFGSSGKVTATQVDTWCARMSVLIDSKIAGKYQTPIDPTASPIAYSLLKEVCVWMVVPKVASVLGVQTGDAKTSTGQGKRQDTAQKAQDTLKEIQSGTMKLVDADLATAADGTESFTNDNSATLQPPTFTREGDDW